MHFAAAFIALVAFTLSSTLATPLVVTRDVRSVYTRDEFHSLLVRDIMEVLHSRETDL